MGLQVVPSVDGGGVEFVTPDAAVGTSVAVGGRDVVVGGRGVAVA